MALSTWRLSTCCDFDTQDDLVEILIMMLVFYQHAFFLH